MYKKDRTFKVLFGFNFEAAERAIFTNIEAYGLKVQGTRSAGYEPLHKNYDP